MALQPFDILSELNSELFETPDSLVLNRILSSPSITTLATTKKRYSKVWHYIPVDRNKVTLNTKGKSI